MQRVGRLQFSNTRRADLAPRFGGEELVIILSEILADRALYVGRQQGGKRVTVSLDRVAGPQPKS